MATDIYISYKTPEVKDTPPDVTVKVRYYEGHYEMVPDTETGDLVETYIRTAIIPVVNPNNPTETRDYHRYYFPTGADINLNDDYEVW